MANVKKDILVGGSDGVLHLVDLVGKSTESMPTTGKTQAPRGRNLRVYLAKS